MEKKGKSKGGVEERIKGKRKKVIAKSERREEREQERQL